MSGTEFITPVGRFVQGSMTLEKKLDPQTNQPKLDAQGQPIMQNFIALAIRKDDPALPAFYAQMVATARAEFPHLFDAAGNCTHPQFAWKLQDGDGVDSQGQSVKDKPGFAGHYIIKMATQFLPKCFHEGKFDPAQQIQNPAEVIKRGYYIRIAGRMRGNGVKPGEQKKPGLFISPDLVSLVAYGEEIQSGPDANKVFGAAPVAALPPGATTTPTLPQGNGLTPPPLPGAAAPSLPAVDLPAPGSMAAPGLPALPAAPTPPAMPTPPAPPAAPAGPQYVMQPSAQGATREQLLAKGWTDETLIQYGHMVKVG